MSEYQYYEFQTIDRPLTAEEQADIDGLSSRVQLTPTRAVFTYNYSDLRADPKTLVAEYFDAYLYLANWGTKQLMFRFPKSLVDVQEMEKYCVEDVVSLHLIDEYVILDIISQEEEGGYWVEGDNWLSSMLRLRDDILQEDYRLLYLAWLMGMPNAVVYGEISEEDNEPPVPPGLGQYSRALDQFVRFFELDSELMKIAEQTSGTRQAVSEEMLRQAISQLPREECNGFLLRLAAGEPHLSLEFKRRLQELIPRPPHEIAPRRTVGYLLATAQEERERERKRQAEEAERQRKKEAEEAERQRIKKLKSLAKQEEQTWQKVEALIQKSQAKPYDQAVRLLVDLKELAEYQGTPDRFWPRIKQLTEKYRRRSALMRRFDQANLR